MPYMKKFSGKNNTIRNKIMGRREKSIRKSYYPLIQKQLDELQEKQKEIEKKNAEYIALNKKANSSNNQKDAILRAIPDLMFTFNHDFTILDYHASYKEQLYVEPEKFINKHLRDVLPEDIAQLTEEKISIVLKHKTVEEYTYQLEYNGQLCTLDARMVYIDESTALAVVRDITNTQTMIEELQAAKIKAEESDKLKSAFLANMSHEIRTPMNGIVGFSELYTDSTFSEQERQKFAKSVINSSHQLLSIVNDILDFSRIESGTMIIRNQEISIPTLVDELNMIYAKEAKEKQLQFNFDATNCKYLTISTDPVKLRQVLNNILSNAFKFTKQGSITFTVKAINDVILFSITDTGSGIPDHMQNRVFERFVQLDMETSRRYGGTGLGLSISKKLAEMLGGTISLESILGKGSTFSIQIPTQMEQV